MPDRPGILITRASPGAEESAGRIATLGYMPILSPALEMQALPAKLDLSGLSGLVFTSANGVRAFAAASARRDLMAWCVGPATEAAALEAGFCDLSCAHGDSTALGDLILSHPAPEGGVLHVANEAAAGDLVARLQGAGRVARFLALYAMRPVSKLMPEASAAFSTGNVQAVLVHSARGAESFAHIANDLDLSQIHLVAISKKAAMPLVAFSWAGQQFAAAPNEDALMLALKTAMADVSG
ncbi:MAG: uroporphyrinogen-III synthase [Hyphomonadaceae bacterium]|nr:uroporphyrinogen-III synthase [Hyphomonadaceae bacterium]